MIIFSQYIPAVYANVPNLRDWIDETMENHGGGQFCPAPSSTEATTPIPTPIVGSKTESKCKCGVKKSSKIVGGQEVAVSVLF